MSDTSLFAEIRGRFLCDPEASSTSSALGPLDRLGDVLLDVLVIKQVELKWWRDYTTTIKDAPLVSQRSVDCWSSSAASNHEFNIDGGRDGFMIVRVWASDFEPDGLERAVNLLRVAVADGHELIAALSTRLRIEAELQKRKHIQEVRRLLLLPMTERLWDDIFAVIGDLFAFDKEFGGFDGAAPTHERSTCSMMIEALVRRLHGLAFGSDLLRSSGGLRLQFAEEGSVHRVAMSLLLSSTTTRTVRCLTNCFPASRPEPSESPPLENALLHWTYIHRLAHDRLQLDAESGDELAEGLEIALNALRVYLDGEPPPAIDRFRAWTRLWLASDTMNHLLERLRLPSPPFAFNVAVRDVAASIREHLRFESHAVWSEQNGPQSPAQLGLHLDYVYQPGAVQRDLCALVEAHAVHVAGLPSTLCIRDLLLAIGTGRTGSTRLMAAGHLQHVIDHYTLGMFLMRARLAGPKDKSVNVPPVTLGGALVSPSARDPGTEAFKRLRRTFALAALYHDTGLLLFPRPRPVDPNLHREIRALRAPLERVEEATREAGKDMVRLCRAELQPLGLGVEQRDAALRQWLDEQEAEGEPDHALLGAWHLVRAAAAADSLDGGVVQAAARAVLTHGAVGQVVRSGEDPAAFLLILCDEIMEWDPISRPDQAVQTILRAPTGRGLELAPHRARMESVRIQGLRLEYKPEYRTPHIHLDGSESVHIKVGLVSPDQRDQSLIRAWLITAQNLNRLEVTLGSGLPKLFVTHSSTPPAPQAGLRTRPLLERAVHDSALPIRGYLERWLAGATFGTDEESTPETLTLSPQGAPLADRDIRPFLDELVDHARRIDRPRRPHLSPESSAASTRSGAAVRGGTKPAKNGSSVGE